MSNYSHVNTGVKAAMAKISLSADMKTYITNNKDLWETFGKMSSHLYREQLMKSMITAELKPDQMFMVFFLFSVIKNQTRVVRALSKLSEAEKAQSWFQPVNNFITNRVCQYVTQAKDSGKFPAVNIPTCNPGLDIYAFTLMAKDEHKTIDNLKIRTTLSQMHLDTNAQAKAKEGYTEYWTNVVKGTKNKDNKGDDKELPSMNEDYYNTGASDKYRLLNDKFEEIPVPEGGYTIAHLEQYLKTRTIVA